MLIPFSSSFSFSLRCSYNDLPWSYQSYHQLDYVLVTQLQKFKSGLATTEDIWGRCSNHCCNLGCWLSVVCLAQKRFRKWSTTGAGNSVTFKIMHVWQYLSIYNYIYIYNSGKILIECHAVKRESGAESE